MEEPVLVRHDRDRPTPLWPEPGQVDIVIHERLAVGIELRRRQVHADDVVQLDGP
jgi:hypothetical protein